MAQNVVGVLQYLFAVRGNPQHIRSASGPESVARTVCRWLNQAEVKPLFNAKGSPRENERVDSLHSKLRVELLNREIFLSLVEARWVMNRWRLDYNHHRPHSAPNYQTPAAYADSSVLTNPILSLDLVLNSGGGQIRPAMRTIAICPKTWLSVERRN